MDHTGRKSRFTVQAQSGLCIAVTPSSILNRSILNQVHLKTPKTASIKIEPGNLGLPCFNFSFLLTVRPRQHFNQSTGFPDGDISQPGEQFDSRHWMSAVPLDMSSPKSKTGSHTHSQTLLPLPPASTPQPSCLWELLQGDRSIQE